MESKWAHMEQSSGSPGRADGVVKTYTTKYFSETWLKKVFSIFQENKNLSFACTHILKYLLNLIQLAFLFDIQIHETENTSKINK